MEPKDQALEIFKLEPQAAAERLDSLPVEQRVELVLSLPDGKRRMDLILMSSRPEELTRALPPEDLVLGIKDLGDTDAVPLLEMASNPQLNYLFDLELWIREGMDLGRLLYWIEILFECGKPRVHSWIRSVDFELLVLLFERTVLLLEPDELENLPGRLNDRIYTPDNTHYLLIKLGTDYGLMKQLLDLMFAKDPDLFFALTGNLGTNPPAEVEELAYRWRTGRLADRGWPDLDEAMELYQPAEPGQVRPGDQLPFGIDDPPRFPLERRYTGRLLQAGIEKLDRDPRNLVAGQLANLINRVIIADGMIPGKAESLQAASARVRGRLEIGLGLLGAADQESSARLLGSVPLVDVAKVAQGAIAKRVQRARKIVSARSAGLLDWLPQPLPDCLKALLASRPLFVPLEEMLPREFKDGADLDMLDKDLDLVEAAFILGDALGLKRGESPEGLTFYTLLLTGFARKTVGLESRVAPFPAENLKELFEQLPRERDLLYQKLREWSGSLVDPPPPGLDRLTAALVNVVWQELLVHKPEELDPRFVEGLWLVK